MKENEVLIEYDELFQGWRVNIHHSKPINGDLKRNIADLLFERNQGCCRFYFKSFQTDEEIAAEEAERKREREEREEKERQRVAAIEYERKHRYDSLLGTHIKSIIESDFNEDGDPGTLEIRLCNGRRIVIDNIPGDYAESSGSLDIGLE